MSGTGGGGSTTQLVLVGLVQYHATVLAQFCSVVPSSEDACVEQSGNAPKHQSTQRPAFSRRPHAALVLGSGSGSGSGSWPASWGRNELMSSSSLEPGAYAIAVLWP